MSGKIIAAEFILNGQKYLALDGGPYFHFNEAISMTIECDDQKEIDYFWDKLSHVQEAEQCGWVKDKFGLSWQMLKRTKDEILASNSVPRGRGCWHNFVPTPPSPWYRKKGFWGCASN